MSIKPIRTRLDGPTMGTSWSVQFDSTTPQELPALQAALQQAVQQVDQQMSTWSPNSDLMRFNAAPLETWVPLPGPLMQVLATGLQISRDTGGAFELNVGSAVKAWGFGADALDLGAIQVASKGPRIRAIDALHLDIARSCARKSATLALDLSGIAKGYGVDRLVQVLADFGIAHALCAIDGELRALGPQADGTPWPVAVETPDAQDRCTHSVLALADGAVATSGDYRHFMTVKGHRLSHTIDPSRGSPAVGTPASVSVLAQDCMQADAMATALMIMGPTAGLAHARQNDISALFLIRAGDAVKSIGSGLFNPDPPKP